MYLRSLLVAALCWALPVAADTPLIGLDRNERALPWKAVGRLETASGYCTATLIAPDTVLSAAHCLYGSDGTRLKADAFTFHAGFRNGTAQATRAAVQIAVPEAYRYKGNFTLGEDDDWTTRIANDVALLRLATPIPTHEIAPFVIEPRALNGGTVSVVSYGRGRDSLPSLQHECTVQQAFEGMFLMDCDITYGSSGAPVFRREGQRTRIASVISGYVRINGTRYTTAAALPAQVAALKAQLRAQAPRPAARIKRIGVGDRPTQGAKFVRPGGS